MSSNGNLVLDVRPSILTSTVHILKSRKHLEWGGAGVPIPAHWRAKAVCVTGRELGNESEIWPCIALRSLCPHISAPITSCP